MGASNSSSSSNEPRQPAQPSKIRLPELIPIPHNAPAKSCECGARFWWVEHKNRRVPVSCPTTLETKSAGVVKLPTQPPGAVSAGVGIDHHIDCPLKRKYTGAATAHAAPPAERPRVDVAAGTPADVAAAKIRAAEALAEQYGVRCTGAPGLAIGETCGGFAVVALLLDGRLFAAPCPAHADAVQRALRMDRRASYRAHPLQEFLVDRGETIARKFAEKARVARDWNRDTGFHVPKSQNSPKPRS